MPVGVSSDQQLQSDGAASGALDASSSILRNNSELSIVSSVLAGDIQLNVLGRPAEPNSDMQQ